MCVPRKTHLHGQQLVYRDYEVQKMLWAKMGNIEGAAHLVSDKKIRTDLSDPAVLPALCYASETLAVGKTSTPTLIRAQRALERTLPNTNRTLQRSLNCRSADMLSRSILVYAWNAKKRWSGYVVRTDDSEVLANTGPKLKNRGKCVLAAEDYQPTTSVQLIAMEQVHRYDLLRAARRLQQAVNNISPFLFKPLQHAEGAWKQPTKAGQLLSSTQDAEEAGHTFVSEYINHWSVSEEEAAEDWARHPLGRLEVAMNMLIQNNTPIS
ncbi:unnamed protein product [Haemonchus placei]|uniref:Uncharacterized protein n=1 Tax=Haemonchus placei TaxID=6290 RepID=A0A0N4WK33_HAEPC|nr:unnamed protein product [Haemonchus placei]